MTLIGKPSQTIASSSDGIKDETIAVFILLGKTGTGKSSFIELLGGKDTIDECPPKISKGIDSCTAELTPYTTTFRDRKILLLDTPGFDDSGKENLENLLDIVSNLYRFTKKDVQIYGVIFLHDISETRFSGSQKKTFSILKNLCGEKCMGNVIIGTTMWASREDPVRYEEQEEREQQLLREHWNGVYKTTRLPRGDANTAFRVISDLLDKRPVSLLVQEEMCKPPHTPESTTAIKAILPDIFQEAKRVKIEWDRDEENRGLDDQARGIASAKRREFFEFFSNVFDALRTPPDANFPTKLGLAFLRPVVIAPLALISTPIGLVIAFADLFRSKPAA